MAVLHLEKPVGLRRHGGYPVTFDPDPIPVNLGAGTGKKLPGRQTIETEIFANFPDAFDSAWASIKYDRGTARSSEEQSGA